LVDATAAGAPPLLLTLRLVIDLFAPASAAVGDWQGALLASASLRALRAGLACIGGTAVAVAGTTVTAVGATAVSAGLAGNSGVARAPCAVSGGAALAAADGAGTAMSIAVSVAISVPGGARALSAASAALDNRDVGAAVLALSTMTNSTAPGGGCPFSSQMVALMSEVSATGASVQPLVLVGADAKPYVVSAVDVANLAAAAAAATITPSPVPAGAASVNVAAVAGGADPVQKWRMERWMRRDDHGAGCSPTARGPTTRAQTQQPAAYTPTHTRTQTHKSRTHA
jgi:hypothetical protein